MFLSPFEWTIAKRYLWPGKGEGFIKLVAGISIGVVMLSVAMLVIVMSVMNGFRAELLDKIVGLNGHAIVQAYGQRLDNWESVLEDIRETPGVVKAAPLIDQPLMVTFNGRVEGIIVRGNTAEDIAELSDKVVLGDMRSIEPGAEKVAIGARLAENIGARVGDVITIINPAGRPTPFGTVPRQVGYEVGAIFEVGLYDYDGAFVVMPISQAQTLLLTGDTIGMIEVTTEDAERVSEIMAPIEKKLAGIALVRTWQQINSSIFEALQVERVAMFFALSFMVLVAAFRELVVLSNLVEPGHAGPCEDARHRDHANDGGGAAVHSENLRHHRFHCRGDRHDGGARARRSGADLPPVDSDRHQLGDGAGPVESRSALPDRIAVENRPLGDFRDRRAGVDPQLPGDTLPGFEGRQHRSCAGASL